MSSNEVRPIDADTWAARLEHLGRDVRQALTAARTGGQDMARAVAQEGGDTIFAIDRHVEPLIEQAVSAWAGDSGRLLLIAEGMGADGRKQFGAGPGGSGGDSGGDWRVIVDPIDGTRNIMYDKRSAWFIAAVAPDLGEATGLKDAVASAIVELPTSKAGYADAFRTVRGGPVRASRVDLRSGEGTALPVRPSAATTLRNGFAQVSNFFPGTKVLAAELMERIAHATLGPIEPGSAGVFDDQYITTGGQMVELIVGHDRFCCDLRPLLYKAAARQSGRDIRGLECHPYDVAGLLVAQQAGVIITDGLGQTLNVPLDVHHGVHWCGYANATLRAAIEPVILEWLQEKGVVED